MNVNNFSHVLSPFSFGKVTTKNRIELSPAGYMLANADGTANFEVLSFYERIAKGGAGIVTIGESAIDYEYADNHKPAINMGSDASIPGLFRINEAVSKYGALLSIELQHSGSHMKTRTVTIGPSAIPPENPDDPESPYCIEMDQEMIDRVVKHWADAAERCVKAGLKMVMLHGGHGHLLAQFVSPYANKRTDKYGGSLENRARFPIEVLTAIKERCPDLTIEYRISADELVEGGMKPDDVIRFVKLIEDKIDLLHVSVGYLSEERTVPRMIQPTYYPHQLNVHYAEYLKQHLSIPITTVGSISTMEDAEEIIASGKADIVAMARAIFADNDIVNNARLGKADKTRPCLRCFNCNKRTTRYLPIRCSVNPELGRAVEIGDIKPAVETKKLVVIGGGPGGMRAAMTASRRGIQTVLFEKEPVLGGNLRMASELSIKADMRKYLNWLIKTTMETEGVEVRLNTTATKEAVLRENPDAVIIAGGSTPILPKFPGSEKNNVLWVGDAYKDLSQIGNNVLIIGAGNTGAETALSLTKDGKKVTVVDMMPEDKIKPQWTVGLGFLLEEYGAKFIFETGLSSITEEGAIVKSKGDEEYLINADTIILSLGFRSRKNLIEEFGNIVPQTYVIGDNRFPDSSMEATHDGFNTVCILP